MFYLALGAPFIFLSASAYAALSDPRIGVAKLCTQQFTVQEQVHHIPSQLLAAIANTESGRWNDTLGMVLPWPWTINAEGKGYYFDSKAEAVRKVKALQAAGMKSIDIGCMQVNLKHHPKAFASIEQAFEPRHNVAYAAKFLRSNYDEANDWSRAIGAYHSKTPKYGNKYRARVQKAWSAISGKVKLARESLGGPRRPTSNLSYRVISVEGEGGVSRARAIRPERSKAFSLAMRDEAVSSGQGIALRVQDRLSSLPNVGVPKPSYKRIRASGVAKPPSTTIIRPRAQGQGAASALSNTAVRDTLVSHHGTAAKNGTSSGVKPKFIFVD